MNEAEPPATAEAQSAKPSIDREQLNALIAENGRQIAKLKARSEAPDTWTESVEQLKSMLLTEWAEAIMYDLVHMLRLTNPVRATCQDLYDYANQLQLPRQERMSFACADLVFQAQGAHGGSAWYSVEIYWTIRARDLERVRQNAQLLQQATGIPAHAVAAGKGYAPDLDWCNVYWLDLSDD